jgi:DNA-binding protein YbaB
MRSEFNDLLSRYGEMSAGLSRITAELADLRATARAADGSVTATVDARGALLAIAFEPSRTARLDTRALAARVLEATNLAMAQARSRSEAAVAAALPEPLRAVLAADGSLDIGRLLPDPASLVSGGGR